MILRIKLAFAFALIAGPALAQTAPDPAFIRKMLTVTEGQRNGVMTNWAASEARAQTIEEENVRLKDELDKALAEVAKLKPQEPKP